MATRASAGASLPPLDSEQLQRYARHLTLPQFGIEGQQKLAAARVLLIGAGGLGSPAALYLAAAGVGTIGIIDHDVVDISNLQRQVLHGTGALGAAKTESAAARIADLNPHVEVVQHRERISSANAREIISGYDIVVDGSDNFPTRYLVNDACVLTGTPLVYGSIYRFEGQLSLFVTPGGPCYRCLFAEPPAPELVPSCADAGVLGVLPGIVGSLQALEAIKWITGMGQGMAGRLLLFDALTLGFREIAIRRDPDCAVCGEHPTVTELIDYEAFCGVSSFGDAGVDQEVAATELARELVSDIPPMVLDVREQWEHDIAHLVGSTLMPLGELPGRLAELPRDRSIVTLCHKGVRSARAAALLRRAGFSRVRSLAGGIDDWAATVEPGMKRY
jgi:molybdopterin/thiamine biosynthesis adenylyltransferase/rhodanese-related sulfurtransferase